MWGDHGQLALESARVCLINATATGTEILKNLVLPGIGSFTIVDCNKITGEDVGNNFFLCDSDSIGKSRAQVATQMLLEMNPDVGGESMEESLENIIDSDEKFFTKFSVVIVTGICLEKTLFKLSRLLWEANVPLLVCKSIGFIGYMRLQLKEHFVIESHPETPFEDLRLDQPFDELRTYLESFEEFEDMSREKLSHTPYLVILYKYLKYWRQVNNTKDLPKSYDEKKQLKNLITEEMKKLQEKFKEDSIKLELDNFEEALKAINTVLLPSNYIPSETQKILDDPSVESKYQISSFWLKIKALKEFVHKNGCLPLRGSIPDMISESCKFIQLQKIFQSKAKDDTEWIFNCIQADNNNLRVSEEEVKLLCKNAHCLRLLRTSSIESELLGEPLKELVSSLHASDSLNEELIYYLLVRSIDRFYTQFKRFPGQFDDQVDTDVGLLKVNILIITFN